MIFIHEQTSNVFFILKMTYPAIHGEGRLPLLLTALASNFCSLQNSFSAKAFLTMITALNHAINDVVSHLIQFSFWG